MGYSNRTGPSRVGGAVKKQVPDKAGCRNKTCLGKVEIAVKGQFRVKCWYSNKTDHNKVGAQ